MEGHGGGIISIQWQILLIEMSSFLILLAVLAKFVFKPLISFVEERGNQIRSKFDDLDKKKQEIEDIKANHQQQLDALKREAGNIIQEAIKKGNAQKNEIILAAKKEANLLVNKASAEIAYERTKTVAELQKEIANLSFIAASRIIEKSIDKSMADQIVEQFIENGLQPKKLRL